MTAQAQKQSWSDMLFMAMLVATTVCCVYTIQLIFLVAPTEASMGVAQKIFYFHVPSAYGMYLGAAVCFIGSIGYLWRGTLVWDSMARAGADVAVIMGLMVMISGPLWAAKAWGTVWTWDPRLTTSLLSLLIYVAYGILRTFTAGGEAERRFAAALGILGAANLPIIKYSVQKWGGQHPKVISKGGGGLQHPDMKTALLFGFLTFTLLSIVLVWHRAKVFQAQMRLEGMEQEAIELGLAGD